MLHGIYLKCHKNYKDKETLSSPLLQIFQDVQNILPVLRVGRERESSAVGYFRSCIINYLSSHSRLLVQKQLQNFNMSSCQLAVNKHRSVYKKYFTVSQWELLQCEGSVLETWLGWYSYFWRGTSQSLDVRIRSFPTEEMPGWNIYEFSDIKKLKLNIEMWNK